MDNGILVLDAAEDIRDQARRLAELADNGSGYSMSRSQMRVHNIALVIVELCGQVIDEVRAGG
nr:MAG TPA: hypothetical protein [Caudoviricetes sp.]